MEISDDSVPPDDTFAHVETRRGLVHQINGRDEVCHRGYRFAYHHINVVLYRDASKLLQTTMKVIGLRSWRVETSMSHTSRKARRAKRLQRF